MASSDQHAGGRRRDVGRIDGELAYQGRAFDVFLDRVRFPDGSEGSLEIIRHPGASAVLPLYRPGEWSGGTSAAVILLRQYRYAAGGEIWEVPAGTLDPGETPERCALRELQEEAGVRATDLHPLLSIWTTPGFTDERIHLFAATGLSAVDVDVSPDEHEFITRHEMTLAEAVSMVRSGQIEDGKSICTLLAAAARFGTGQAQSGARV